ncbi:type IV secretory system conjugative DNA transfer family protein [Haloarcula sp. 1CSR25-25]|nr:type IV secretory system conjugative DNA transfer family protein [Haloarcula sp. 1CSR25-25]
MIRYLVKALFDPVNGDDAFQHRDLHMAAQEMHDRQSAPAVADEDLERLLSGVVANSARSFDEIMQGVANRIEKIPVDRRLARMFNHVPEDDDRHFDFGEFLDEDVVIIIDTGRVRTDTQRVMTLVLLSNLWSALRRRAQSTPSTESYNLVNVYLEEAASIATSDILQDLLSQSRGFGVGITLAMQFPDQLRRIDDGVYRELLNNVSTYVTGNVPTDDRLASRFTTADMSATEMADQLKWLPRGEWLVQLPAPFDHPEPRPFQVESLPLPAGDPDGPGPTIPTEEIEQLIEDVAERTHATAGLTLQAPSTTDETGDDSDPTDNGAPVRVDSALPHTRRLPETVSYDRESHALHCQRCGNRYDPSIDGMRRAIACCGSLADINPDDVPICTLNLKRSADERADSEWSTSQLCFLQAVYNAQQLRYEPLEYDLLSDSMLRLQEYVGIESDAVQDLCDADVLRHDTDRPHRLYSVTPAGRDAIGESYRRGVDYGHECGDLEESSEHVLAVEAARLYLEHQYVADPASPVSQVVPYYEIQDGSLPAATFMGTDQEAVEAVSESYSLHRLDLVGLDSDGEVRVTVEAERVNNDLGRAVPADFDKMAACDPDEAIWVAMSHDDAHEILAALNDPLEGDPRVEKTYSESTPASSFSIDEPGFTDILTVNQLLDRIDRPDPRDMQS